MDPISYSAGKASTSASRIPRSPTCIILLTPTQKQHYPHTTPAHHPRLGQLPGRRLPCAAGAAITATTPPDTDSTSTALGRVHSIFTHAINISVGDTLLTLCDDPSAGIPDSVVLAPADFARLQLRCDDPVRIARHQLFFASRPPPPPRPSPHWPNYDNRFPSNVYRPAHIAA